ncbi:MAG TPA: GspH/FimT family pseudopilin, partial [Steroidobacteraceae bacterium]|nr:GspH/FimT family pseudopilin [Steroidobacteraceae bacterium]
VPSYQDASLNSQLRSMANDLVSSTHLARSEAFKRNSIVTICVSSNGTTCGAGGWEQGWIVMSGATVLDHQSAAPTGFKITATNGNATLQFQPTGAGSTSETLTVCRATPTVGSTQRIVAIDAVGRVSVSQSTATSCS